MRCAGEASPARGGGRLPRPRLRAGFPAECALLWLALAASPAWGALFFDLGTGPLFNNTGEGFTGPDELCGSTCQSSQKTALLDLFTALGGQHWAQSGGWTEPDGTPVCSWYGVHCCTESHTLLVKYGTLDGFSVTFGNSGTSFGQYCPVRRGVAALVLAGNNLTGTIPEGVFPALGDSLQYLDLHGNELGGPIPPDVVQLENLRELSLHGNALTGPIPPDLGRLTELVALNLNLNRLTGAVPEVVTMTKLTWLEMGHNRLTGSLPIGVFTINTLQTVNLEDNLLSSTPTPDGRTALVDIEIPYLLTDYFMHDLILRDNNFGGPIDPAIAIIPVANIDLSNNAYNGTVPGSLATSPFLQTLDLDNNQLSGPLPSNFSQWSVVTRLDLHNNRLTGTVPDSVGALEALQFLDLSNNRLTGGLPDSLSAAAELAFLDVTGNAGMRHPVLNSRGEKLPEAWTFDTLGLYPQLDRAGMSRDMNCYRLTPSALPEGNQPAKKLLVSPEYFGFDLCVCADNTLRRELVDDGVMRELTCVPDTGGGARLQLAFIVAPLLLVAVLVPLGLFTWFRYRVALARLRLTLKKRRGPPTADDEISLVLTDVEGSTELWEWETEVMALAIDLHDRLIRIQLSEHYGYEITTEGDAFLLAFHEPFDAVAWCLSVQQALVGAEWPPQLYGHKRAAVETAGILQMGRGALAGEGELADLSDKVTRCLGGLVGERSLIEGLVTLGVVFRGLRVRMGIATGKPESVKIHKVTRRTEYVGEVMRRAQAVSETPHGGQIVMDEESFGFINSRLEELGQAFHAKHFGGPPGGMGSALAKILRCMCCRGGGGEREDDAAEGGNARFGQSIGGGGKGGWSGPKEIVVGAQAAGEEGEAAEGEGGGYMGSKGPESGPIMVIDMGIHRLKDIADPNNLVQALIPGMEERGRFFPALESEEQLTPGYFEAPAAKVVPLRQAERVAAPPVTLVFCGLEKYMDMVAADGMAASQVLSVYNDCIRRTLVAMDGYECQEQVGNYMIAFATAESAIEWCLLVQEVMVEIPWTDRVLRLPYAGEVLDDEGQPVFCGPRIKMGIYEGQPVRVVPHSSTGRADYFGQLVNRAARYCFAAAQGGQVIVARELVDGLVAKWLQTDVANAPKPLCGVATILGAVYNPKQWNKVVSYAKEGRKRASRHSMNNGLAPMLDTSHILDALPVGEGLEGDLGMDGPGEDEESPTAESRLQPESPRQVKFTKSTKGWLKGMKDSLTLRGDSNRPDRFGQMVEELNTPRPGREAKPKALKRKQSSDRATSVQKSKGSTSVERHTFMSSFSFKSRMSLGHWVWCGGIQVVDRGMYRFKGVTGVHSIVSVESDKLLCRGFESGVKKGKGECMQAGQGMIYCIRFQGSECRLALPPRLSKLAALQEAVQAAQAAQREAEGEGSQEGDSVEGEPRTNSLDKSLSPVQSVSEEADGAGEGRRLLRPGGLTGRRSGSMLTTNSESPASLFDEVEESSSGGLEATTSGSLRTTESGNLRASKSGRSKSRKSGSFRATESESLEAAKSRKTKSRKSGSLRSTQSEGLEATKSGKLKPRKSGSLRATQSGSLETTISEGLEAASSRSSTEEDEAEKTGSEATELTSSSGEGDETTTSGEERSEETTSGEGGSEESTSSNGTYEGTTSSEDGSQETTSGSLEGEATGDDSENRQPGEASKRPKRRRRRKRRRRLVQEPEARGLREKYGGEHSRPPLRLPPLNTNLVFHRRGSSVLEHWSLSVLSDSDSDVPGGTARR